MYRREMPELVSLYSAILEVLGRRPIAALGSVERVAVMIAMLIDGALLHARFRDPDEVVGLVRATVIPLMSALTVSVDEAEPPDSVLLYPPEEFSLDAPGRWERVLAPAQSTVILGARVLEGRIAELGREISRDYVDRDPILVCVLKSAVVFFADLIRHVTVPSQHGFMCVSSYKGMQSSGEITIQMDLDIDIQGRHVLIVEDIVDTGQTIEHLLAHLAGRRPASLGVCTLLAREDVNRQLDYVGFEVGKGFVIGMGIDLNQRYRQLPLIAQLTPVETELT
jgi:hypoxanthine phosphoribosyltransferase